MMGRRNWRGKVGGCFNVFLDDSSVVMFLHRMITDKIIIITVLFRRAPRRRIVGNGMRKINAPN